jgi:predicted solute-binding protein
MRQIGRNVLGGGFNYVSQPHLHGGGVKFPPQAGFPPGSFVGSRKLKTVTESKFRIGSVPFLNAAPLTRGIESEIIFATPAKLAEMLRRDELDAALVSITEVLLHDRYDILDGVAIASFGEVYSVLLAHRQPLAEAQEIFCDPASLTSVNLLKVLLAERGLRPEFKPLENYATAAEKDFVLLIGDRAIEFQRAPRTHEIFDLGAAWLEMTQLPFVFAIWALRRGIENRELRRELKEAKQFGLETLDNIIETRQEFDADFRRDYFEWHIHFHLGEEEKRAIVRFSELLQKHQLGPVFAPKYLP